MTSTTEDRPYVLFTGSQRVEVEAPDLKSAIAKAEGQTAGRVWIGQSADGGIPSFDPDADLRDFIATHRTPPNARRSKPLPTEYAATEEAAA